MNATFAAVDIGASSGRVILGALADGRLVLDEVARFPTIRVALPSGLHWDLPFTFHSMLDGLRACGEVTSVGIDTWGCDYGLLTPGGELRGLPFHHRDARTAVGVSAVRERLHAAALYARNGLQHLAFNTIFQLAADSVSGRLDGVESMLMIPDLLAYWLTGVRGAEETNASTSGLLDPLTRTWSPELAAAAGLPTGFLPELFPAGSDVGGIRTELAASDALPPSLRVVRVGSHDTASAVVGVPAASDEWAFIACGTWSLVGIETERPILIDAARQANFSNEGGVDGRTRFLRNVSGLWLLQESLREWATHGQHHDLAGLLAAAGEISGGPVIDPDDQRFLAPGDMPRRIAELCDETGQRPPSTPPEVVRCILDSLAEAYALAIEQASALSGRAVRMVHIVGGGSQNALLCQLTADACGRTVEAGPVEATAMGNLVVQARAAGVLTGELEALRVVVRASASVRRYEPRVRRP